MIRFALFDLLRKALNHSKTKVDSEMRKQPLAPILESIIFGNDVQLLKQLIASGEDIEARDRDKRTPLINAAADNKIEMVKLLLQSGADINAQDYIGYTALHFAAQNNYLELAKLLIENNAEIDRQDINGNTPLSSAVFYSEGEGDMINLLLEHGADRNQDNNHGISPLKLARTIGNHNLLQFFE